MTTLALRPRICDDLVPVILEQNDDRWWPCDLQRLALVGPAWLGPVRRRLYAFPTVRSFRACTLLARTFRENPHLVALLEGIDLRPLSDVTRSFTGGAGGAPDMASLRFLLSVQPAHKLILAGDLAIKAERFLQAIATPHAIVELHIDGNLLRTDGEDDGLFGGRRVASLRWDRALASAFPQLRRLRLCNLELEIPHTGGTPPTFRPEDVVLDNVCVAGDVRHLADLSGLRALSVGSRCAPELGAQLQPVLALCAAGLRALHLEAPDAHNDAALLAEHLPRACPTLTELRLHGIRCGADTLLALSHRCQRLERLAVRGRTVQIGHDEWASLVRAGAFPALRELTIPRGAYQPPFVRWTPAMTASIGAACRARGIRLIY